MPLLSQPTSEEVPHRQETGRLQVLRQYGILDTPPEEVFERAVSFAAQLFGAPMAFVTLVDERRQWYKACFGLDLRQSERAFCAYAIEGEGVMVVPDAAKDVRFSDSPFVTGEPYIRFYAGAPLQVRGGHKLGTLCILDTVPRAGLTASEQATLQQLAAGLVSELELRFTLAEQQRGEALKTAILETSLDAIITIDRRGRVTEWNPAAERMFGYGRAEVLDQELGDLIVPQDLRGAHQRGMTHYFQTGEGAVLGRRVEVPALRRDGSTFPCELAITPFQLAEEVMFTAHLRDLSEAKQAEEALAASHNLLRAVVNGVPESIFVKDPDGRYVMINEAGARRIGRPVHAILGQTDHALFAAATAERLRSDDLQVIATGEVLSYEVTDPAPDDPLRTFLSTKQVYRGQRGEVLGLIGTSVDISSRKRAEHLIQEHNQALEVRVRERTRALEQAQFEVLDRLARAAEHRDDDTGEHLRRVAHTSAALARLLGLPAAEVELIERVAPLHDVGKIGVPDAILLKPARLTPEEFEVVKTHTTIGGSILAGSASPLVRAAHSVALTHHERWDGSGYPRGLAGKDIALFGRVVAVADVFDALTTKRPYKRAWTVEEALTEIRAQAGRQFDPQVVEALTDLLHGEGWPGARAAGASAVREQDGDFV